MVGFAKRRRPHAPHQLKTAGSGKRVIVVFGPPGSGVSTVVDCLSRATLTPNKVVPYYGAESISSAEEALKHAELVFLDVDGGVFNAQDVQEIVDNRLVYTGSGAMVRLYAPEELILERAREPNYIALEDLQRWAFTLDPVEAKIRQHILNYFMVPNVELLESVKQLALRSGLES